MAAVQMSASAPTPTRGRWGPRESESRDLSVKTILVVDDDKMILRLSREALKDYEIQTAMNGKDALRIINDRAPDLVLTDLKMPVMDGYELISQMTRHHRGVPIIVMTGFGSLEIARQLKRKGVFHYIEKPFEISDLRKKITDALDARSKGFIHGFTLANFLQAVEVEQKTVTLRITSQGRVGYLHINNGALIDADTESARGEAAAIEILCWDDAEIEMQGIRKQQTAIRSSLMHLLLAASKQKDECGPPADPEAPLSEAIRLAEGHHFKDAHRRLAGLLKRRPRNARAWLWYSRIIITPKSIESSLANARKLAPEDPEVIASCRQLQTAQSHMRGGTLRRCPFCWAPIEARSVGCPCCRGHLVIDDRFFKERRDPDKPALEGAVERYTRVIGREKNLNAYYYLSLAHLNLGHWEEALTVFHKTVNLAPDRKVLSDQLRMLLRHMASREVGADPAEDWPRPEGGRADDSAETASDRKRILVVEDSPTTRKVISITLGQKGYEIIEAKDGLEALSKLNEGQPDLILLDIILPKMDGYKILEIIKKNALFKHIPVIMLTSKDGMISKWKGRLAGSTAYLTKPFDPKMLVATIEKHI
jgi:twitching motility two-component system response regulator PilG